MPTYIANSRNVGTHWCYYPPIIYRIDNALHLERKWFGSWLMRGKVKFGMRVENSQIAALGLARRRHIDK